MMSERARLGATYSVVKELMADMVGALVGDRRAMLALRALVSRYGHLIPSFAD